MVENLVAGIHGTIVAGQQLAAQVVEHHERFLIVATGIALEIDHEESVKTAVQAAAEIIPGAHMRVVPARAAGPRCKGVACVAARRNHRRAFFHRAIDLRWQKESVPVHDLLMR